VKKKINNGKKTLLLDGMARNSKCDPHEKSDQSLPAHLKFQIHLSGPEYLKFTIYHGFVLNFSKIEISLFNLLNEFLFLPVTAT